MVIREHFQRILCVVNFDMICARWFSDYMYWRLTLNLLLTLNAKPIDYLKMFGLSKDLRHKEAEKAELYLLHVLLSYLSAPKFSKFDWEVQCSKICLDWSFIPIPCYFSTKCDCKKYIPNVAIVLLQIQNALSFALAEQLVKRLFLSFFLLIIEFVFY